VTIEEALANLCLNPNDSAAWDVIVMSTYKPLIASVASSLLTFHIEPGESAIDIVHDVLLTFQKRWPHLRARIKDERALFAYLRRSCQNLLVDKYRRQQNADKLVDYLTLNFDSAFPAHQELHRSIFVKQIIVRLPKKCAEMLRVFVTEGLTAAEIAEREGVPPATFYSRWLRCINKAREIFCRKSGT
jgi:RNA polymerase sigma factor (sigma-70 family)